MAIRETIQVVEIDIDYCGQTWGVSPCQAAYTLDVGHKCFNTFYTCQYRQAYTKTVKTLRFCSSSYGVRDGNYYPVLKSVSGREQEVNIAGFSKEDWGLGRRASVRIEMADFADRDVLTDKYWGERMSGSAQQSGIGYDPMERGSFWTKFRARNPNYAGRPLRVIEAHFADDGTLVYDQVRHYVMDNISAASSNGVTITAKDILALADDERAQCPRTSQGALASDINDTQTTFNINPPEYASQYPASGMICIGSEVMQFSRSGATMNVIRGSRGTSPAGHSINDTIQLCYDPYKVRGDVIIRDLLVNYGNIPASYIDTAAWAAEFNRWGNQFVLSTTITKPVGVSKLLAEICQLGVTIWWDELAQKVRLRLNRPEEDEIATWSDLNTNISISMNDNDNQRATRVELNYVQIDPTKELNAENFSRAWLYVDGTGESPEGHGLPRKETIYTRWLNHGAGNFAKILTGRLLNRFKVAPSTFEITLDEKDSEGIASVINLVTSLRTDATGDTPGQLSQVYYVSTADKSGRVKVRVQSFQFDARYGTITENSRPVYNLSSEAQKKKGTYWVGPSLVFSDGRRAYQFV